MTINHGVIVSQRYVDVAEAVAKEHGFTLDELRGMSRHASISIARRAAMIAVRKEGASYVEVGAVFSRDHSSAISAINGKRRKNFNHT